jgi:hypothetical protein
MMEIRHTFLGSIAILACLASPMTPVHASDGKTDAPLTVAIAIPLRGSQRMVELSADHPHFHVVISNTSNAPQRIWREAYSWGYFALTFELTDASGKIRIVRKKARGWHKNIPDFWTVLAHEDLVIEVDVANRDIWDGFPQLHGAPEPYTMRAIFEVTPDEQSQKNQVWTGTVASAPASYVFFP